MFQVNKTTFSDLKYWYEASETSIFEMMYIRIEYRMKVRNIFNKKTLILKNFLAWKLQDPYEPCIHGVMS